VGKAETGCLWQWFKTTEQCDDYESLYTYSLIGN